MSTARPSALGRGDPVGRSTAVTRACAASHRRVERMAGMSRHLRRRGRCRRVARPWRMFAIVCPAFRSSPASRFRAESTDGSCRLMRTRPPNRYRATPSSGRDDRRRDDTAGRRADRTVGYCPSMTAEPTVIGYSSVVLTGLSVTPACRARVEHRASRLFLATPRRKVLDEYPVVVAPRVEILRQDHHAAQEPARP